MPISQERMKRTAIRAAVQKLCLSTTILSALSAPALAQQVKADGSSVIVPADSNIVTTGEYAAGAGLYTLNGGSILSYGPLYVQPTSLNSYAVYAQSGGTMDLTGATILASRGNSTGVFANGAGSQITLSNSKVTMGAGRAMRVDAGGEIVANNVDISNTGNGYAAAYVSGVGASLIYSGGTIFTTGTNSPAVDVRVLIFAEN